jgi:SAM-dependent methyltransferase
MYHRLKRWFKNRLPQESLAWRVLLAVGVVVNYPKHMVRRLRKDSTFRFESEMDMASLFPRAILDVTIERLSPGSVLDVGCGTGRSLEYFVARGIDAAGVEGSARAIAKAAHPERIIQANLNHGVDLGRRFDLVWSYEVAEHIHPDFVGALMETFSRHGDRVVISAARPGQGGQGHFNEQPPEYWIERFGEHGYRLDQALTAELRRQPDEFAGNMLAFVRP